MPKLTYGTHTPKSLQAIGDSLIRLGGLLRGHATFIEEQGFESLELPYEDAKERSIGLLTKFVGGVPGAIGNAMQERGDFAGGQGSPKKKRDNSSRS